MSRVDGIGHGSDAIVLFPGVLGQHGGHGGGGRGGRRVVPEREHERLQVWQDFNHALAVQATPDQASQFQALAKSTEAARKLAQELLR